MVQRPGSRTPSRLLGEDAARKDYAYGHPCLGGWCGGGMWSSWHEATLPRRLHTPVLSQSVFQFRSMPRVCKFARQTIVPYLMSVSGVSKNPGFFY
jgi:hypothetical protein